jgi:hypothetical protein
VPLLPPSNRKDSIHIDVFIHSVMQNIFMKLFYIYRGNIILVNLVTWH